jgi:cell division transport system permease protein
MHPRAFIRTPLDLAVPRDATALLLVSTLALMGYLATLGGLAFVLLGDDLRAWNRSLDDSLTLQIPAETSAARIEMSLALLRQTRGIAELRLLDQAETARLLEPWLGPAAAPDTLPIPRLLDIRAEPGAAIDIADLRQKLAAITPGSQLEDHRPALALHRRAATRLAILIALGIAGVAVFAVVLTATATSLRLALHRGAVELLHLIGAADADLAWPVQLAALRQGLVGGVIGAAAALLTLFVIGPLMSLDASPTAADWRLWGVAVGVIAVAGFGAMSAARLAVLRQLARMP